MAKTNYSFDKRQRELKKKKKREEKLQRKAEARETKVLAGEIERVITTSRVVDASCAKVFRAFSEPSHLENWWGPSGFKNTFSEFDFRPGGSWRLIMHGPNGVDYPNQSEFLEIAPAERIVFKHLSAPEFTMTISLQEEEGKTVVGWRMLFETAASRDTVATYALDANEQNLDRLEAELATMP